MSVANTARASVRSPVSQRTRRRARLVPTLFGAAFCIMLALPGLALPARAFAPSDGATPPETSDQQAGPYETMTYDQSQAFWQFQEAVFHDVDQFWKQRFGEWGYTWVPYITFYPVKQGTWSDTPCGPAGDPAEFTNVHHAFYCTATDPPTMWISEGWMLREIYRAYNNNDKAVAVLIAHEFAHHVQHSLGIKKDTEGGVLTSREHELQADCLAGNWARSAYYQGYITEDDAAGISDAFGRMEDPNGQTHGTADERRAWFWHGLNDGNSQNCNTQGWVG